MDILKYTHLVEFSRQSVELCVLWSFNTLVFFGIPIKATSAKFKFSEITFVFWLNPSTCIWIYKTMVIWQLVLKTVIVIAPFIITLSSFSLWSLKFYLPSNCSSKKILAVDDATNVTTSPRTNFIFSTSEREIFDNYSKSIAKAPGTIIV